MFTPKSHIFTEDVRRPMKSLLAVMFWGCLVGRQMTAVLVFSLTLLCKGHHTLGDSANMQGIKNSPTPTPEHPKATTHHSEKYRYCRRAGWAPVWTMTQKPSVFCSKSLRISFSSLLFPLLPSSLNHFFAWRQSDSRNCVQDWPSCRASMMHTSFLAGSWSGDPRAQSRWKHLGRYDLPASSGWCWVVQEHLLHKECMLG